MKNDETLLNGMVAIIVKPLYQILYYLQKYLDILQQLLLDIGQWNKLHQTNTRPSWSGERGDRGDRGSRLRLPPEEHGCRLSMEIQFVAASCRDVIKTDSYFSSLLVNWRHLKAICSFQKRCYDDMFFASHRSWNSPRWKASALGRWIPVVSNYYCVKVLLWMDDVLHRLIGFSPEIGNCLCRF